MNSLDDSLEKLKNIPCVIVTGDINIDLLNDSPNAVHLTYQCLMTEHGLLPAITHPTRGKACLDHGYVKLRGTDAQGVVCESSITDHHLILLGFNCCYRKAQAKNRFLSKIDYPKVIEEVRQLDWVDVTATRNIDDAVHLFNRALSDVITKHTSKIKMSRAKFNLKPWVTPGLVRCIRHRDNLHAQTTKQPENDALKVIYTRYRNYCNNILRQRKAEYDRIELEKNIKEPKKLWRTIKDICQVPKRNNDSHELLKYKGNYNISINACNEYFVSVGQNLATDILNGQQRMGAAKPSLGVVEQNQPKHSLFLHPTDSHEIGNIIDDLKADSAPGLDEFRPLLHKYTKKYILEPITYICNLSMETGTVPACWKTAVITPIHKSGSKDSPDNYRPISLLCVTSKILEKVINNRLVNFLEEHSLLSERQFGFCRGKSTSQAVSLLTTIVSSNIDRGRRSAGIFLDLAKAFDTVSISTLLKKLETFGVRGLPLEWFRSYLSGRHQLVKIGEYVSAKLPIAFGVPQGSILGPTLFIMYMNDLLKLNIAQSDIICYADDTTVIFNGATWAEARNAAENGMAVIAAWLEQNLLTLNLKKTHFLTFHLTRLSRPNFETLKIHHSECNVLSGASVSNTSCNCNVIHRVDTTRYLGVIIDQNLSFKPHIQALAKKTRKFIYVAKLLRTCAPKNICILVYTSLCHSVLQYCVEVWGGASKTCMLELERAQRAVLKVLLGKPRRFSTDDLYKEAGVLRVRQLFILVSLLKLVKDKTAQTGCSKRGRTPYDRIRLPKLKTLFAARFSTYLPIRIFNAVSRIFAIPREFAEAKAKLKKWLLDRTYEETETLLCCTSK